MADEDQEDGGRVVQLGATVSGTSEDGVGREGAHDDEETDDGEE